jgi:ABC-type nitrate/sulfonate/bicarbonate transport system substrate-binding protein
MACRKQIITVAITLAGACLLALIGGFLGNKPRGTDKDAGPRGALKCAYDGTSINPLYQVEVHLSDETVVSLCSIYCASAWLEMGKSNVAYITVVDELTGQKFDASLGRFVESEVVTVKAVNNRIHAFFREEHALDHVRQFNGRILENPVGRTYVPPAIARFDSMSIGAPHWPDSLPLKLAIFKPIFKESRLDVRFVPVKEDAVGRKLLADGIVQGLVCDLPTALLLASSQPGVKIIKNVLRANPYRPLFAIVSGPNSKARDLKAIAGQRIAVPKGISYQFYLEYYLKLADITLESVLVREVEDVSEAWNLLANGEVAAALLRTPYTDIAIKNNTQLLADDRNLPWMSVLLVNQSTIENQSEILKRLLFGLEQSVLALNLKPDEYRTFLREQGIVPDGAYKHFSMPIFEGANAPAKIEIEPILQWLQEKGLLNQSPSYEDLVNAGFLPDPNKVGLAFCCQ